MNENNSLDCKNFVLYFHSYDLSILMFVIIKINIFFIHKKISIANLLFLFFSHMKYLHNV